MFSARKIIWISSLIGQGQKSDGATVASRAVGMFSGFALTKRFYYRLFANISRNSDCSAVLSNQL